MVDANGQDVLVHVPQLLEDEFGQEASVAEHQGGAVGLYLLIELRHGPGSSVPTPRHPRLVRQQDRQFGIRTLFPGHNGHAISHTARGQPPRKGLRIGQGRRQPDPLHPRRKRLEAGQRQGEQVPALRRGKGVDLVNHDPLQASEQPLRLGVGQQQRERFGRGQQDMGRIGALARLAVRRGIAAAHFHPQRQAQFRDRRQQVALHIVRQGLERRDVKRVKSVWRSRSAQLRGAECGQGRQEPAQRLARPCIGDQEGVAALPGDFQHFRLMPPQAPATGGEPLVQFRGKHLGHEPCKMGATARIAKPFLQRPASATSKRCTRWTITNSPRWDWLWRWAC